MKHHLKYPGNSVETEETKPGQKRKDSGFHIGPLIFLPQPRQSGSSTISGFGQSNTNIHKAQCHICIYIYCNQLKNNSNIANNNDNDNNNN